MIEPFGENAVEVTFIGTGLMKDKHGNTYVCDADGCGHPQNLTTGELFYISKRDAHENPVSLVPLSAMEG